jgi:hypothetical protein
MSYGDKPFGLSDIKVTNSAGSQQADLAAAQTLSIKPRLMSAELRGDDRIKAVASIVEALEWQLGAGGISLSAYAIMTGQGTTVTGTSPTEKTTFNLAAGDSMPYFKIYGKSLGDNGDDVHVKLYKCKITSLSGSFADGQYWITDCSGIAVDDDSNGIIDVVQNETATTLPTT